MRDLCGVPVLDHGRNARNGCNDHWAQTRAMMLTAGAALLLIVQFAWATLARAQADIDLGNTSAIGVFTTNTDWSIAKNGGFANGTASWTVGVTKISVSNQTVEVFGRIAIQNTGTGPAKLGNIIVNLQRPCPAANVFVSEAVDVADATFGQAATYGNFVSSASHESLKYNKPGSLCAGPGNYELSTPPDPTVDKTGTLYTTAASGTVDFINAADNSVFSLVPEFKLRAGQLIRLFYTATFDNLFWVSRLSDRICMPR